MENDTSDHSSSSDSEFGVESHVADISLSNIKPYDFEPEISAESSGDTDESEGSCSGEDEDEGEQ